MVEWKKIEDVCKVLTGGDAPENCVKGQSKPSIEYPYPVYSNGDEVYGFCSSYRVSENAVTISSIGNVGSVNFRLANFTPIIRLKVVIPCCPHLLTKFLFYNLLGYKFVGTSSSLSSMKAADIKRLSIPIPSLSEQNRIVSILDTFTSSIDNLKAQIAQRRKQFEFYRDQLLELEGKDGVEMVAMKELFTIKNGYTPSKSHPEYWDGGALPWFRMEDIRLNGRILCDSIQHITPLGVKKGGLFPANSIIVATTATIGEHALIIVDSLANQQFTFLTKCKSYDSKLDMKYMYYYMFIVDEWCKKNTNVSGFASVDMEKFKKLPIPLPPLAEQHRIVSILDTFEASISNLEAQLEQRQKQYEYYRNQLLTFD